MKRAEQHVIERTHPQFRTIDGDGLWRRRTSGIWPAKVANQVLAQLHRAWIAFFEAMESYQEHPERFRGRPGLPKILILICLWRLIRA